MEMTYSKEDLKNIIKSYYLQKEQKNVDVSILTRKELLGFYGTLSSITTITITQNVTLLGRDTKVSEVVSKDKIINIFSELLESEGYTLESLKYDEGIETQTVGYFMNEHQEQTAYFKGIKIKANKVNSLSKKIN